MSAQHFDCGGSRGSGAFVGRSNPLNYGVYPVTDFILVAALTMGHVRKYIVRRVNARWKLCKLNFFVFIVETATVLDAV